MRLFVADTGPLLHLHQIGAVQLLPQLGEVWTTPVVAQELQRHAPELCGAAWPPWLRVAEVSVSAQMQAHQWRQAGLLHAGEAEALAHARELHPDAFLTDDGDAREFARIYGLESRGTLGIVLLAATRGLVSGEEAARLLDQLEVASTLWLSPRVARAAREALQIIFPEG